LPANMRRQICEAARSWLRTPALQVCDDCSDIESVTIGILMAGRNGVDPSVGSGGLEAVAMAGLWRCPSRSQLPR
jgi:hypothetical protein